MAAFTFHDLGELACTTGALDRVGERGMARALNRHLACDWSELTEHDRRQNEIALETGERIFSSYSLPGGVVWVITEADRSVTTVLTPEEY